MKSSDKIIDTIVSYYSEYDEQSRLASSWGQVEFLRTQSIIGQYLKSPPAVVLDVGGAAGRYACWLAGEGYTVHLIDPVPLHVRQAQAASDAQPETPIASCQVGDARELTHEAETADAVLLLGPLYHLVEAQDRARALSEAQRVLKHGGHLFAAGISRFASTTDGLISGYFADPAFQQIMLRDLETGQHRNPTGNPTYFTNTFLHHPDELRSEVAQAGFQIMGLHAIEGISYMMKDFAKNWIVKEYRELLLEVLDKTGQDPSLLGASPHMLCVGIKR